MVIGDGVVITQGVYIILTSCKDVPTTSLCCTCNEIYQNSHCIRTASDELIEGWHRSEGIHSCLKSTKLSVEMEAMLPV